EHRFFSARPGNRCDSLSVKVILGDGEGPSIEEFDLFGLVCRTPFSVAGCFAEGFAPVRSHLPRSSHFLFKVSRVGLPGLVNSRLNEESLQDDGMDVSKAD